jgi:hypothetical protein
MERMTSGIVSMAPAMECMTSAMTAAMTSAIVSVAPAMECMTSAMPATMTSAMTTATASESQRCHCEHARYRQNCEFRLHNHFTSAMI